MDTPPSPAPLRILIVDNDADTVDSTAQLVQLWGHRTARAYDGQQALDVARTWHPNVVLLDLGMPGMDGYKVARQLRIELGPGLYLVAVSGYCQAQDQDRCLATGFDRFLKKPAELLVLRDLLASLAR
jgi:two-component system CheB/CheR fusion protein